MMKILVIKHSDKFLQRKGVARGNKHTETGPRGYKSFFMLNSAEHENFSANKYEHANEIFSANKYENANDSWHVHIY